MCGRDAVVWGGEKEKVRGSKGGREEDRREGERKIRRVKEGREKPGGVWEREGSCMIILKSKGWSCEKEMKRES